jgi:hypothetical protein
MKFCVKTLLALVGSLAIMGTMAATPASACHGKRHHCHRYHKVHCCKHQYRHFKHYRAHRHHRHCWR